MQIIGKAVADYPQNEHQWHIELEVFVSDGKVCGDYTHDKGDGAGIGHKKAGAEKADLGDTEEQKKSCKLFAAAFKVLDQQYHGGSHKVENHQSLNIPVELVVQPRKPAHEEKVAQKLLNIAKEQLRGEANGVDENRNNVNKDHRQIAGIDPHEATLVEGQQRGVFAQGVISAKTGHEKEYVNDPQKLCKIAQRAETEYHIRMTDEHVKNTKAHDVSPVLSNFCHVVFY